MKKSDLSRVEDIHVRGSKEIASVVESMGRGGGFMGRNVYEAARIFLEMAKTSGCIKFLSIPAAPIATGTRGVIVDLVRRGLVDVIVTTAGTLDHDIARTDGAYYQGSFGLDDKQVFKAGYHRLGNVLVPISDYGPAIEKRVQPLLAEIYASGKRSVTTEELCREIGKDLGNRESLLFWAEKKGVPVFIPGIMDGAVGNQIWLFSESHRDFKVDPIGDEGRLSDIVAESKSSGALVLGGGISKHHLLWWNQFRGGLDMAVYITTAPEYDGSLSGAQVREAISWGKVKSSASNVTLYADLTTVLPLIVGYVLYELDKS